MERGDLGPVSNGDAEPLELVNEVVGHRLAEVGAAMEEGDERAAAGEPDGCLAGGVAAADDCNARTGAEPRLGRTGGVEDRRSLELRKAVDRESAVLGARCEQDGARGDLPFALEADEVPAVSGFEGQRAVPRRRACLELARLGDRARGQLVAADSGGKAEVVLDPAGQPCLAAERGALRDQRVEPLGGGVDRSCEARRTGADDQEVNLLARCEVEPHPERAQQLAVGRPVQLFSARQAHERQRPAARRGLSRQLYGSRFARTKSSTRIVASDCVDRRSPSRSLQPSATPLAER